MKNEQGQTLLEVLTATGVMVILVTAITVTVLSALNNATYSKNQNLATQYAQEGIEIMRNMRDTDYQAFSSLQGKYCLGSGCTSLDGSANCDEQSSTNPCTNNVGSFFTRIIKVPPAASDCQNGTTEVQSVVSWSDGHCPTGTACHQVQVTSCFSNTTVPVP